MHAAIIRLEGGEIGVSLLTMVIEPSPPIRATLAYTLWVWLNQLTQAGTLRVEPLGEPRGSPEHK